MTTTNAPRLLLAGAVVLAVAGAVAVALGGRGSHHPSHTAGATPTTAAAGAGAGAAAPPGAAAGPTTAAPDAGGSATAKTAAPAWHLPSPGTYRYHFARFGDQPVAYDATVVVVGGGATSYTETRDHQSAKMLRSYAAGATGVSETGFTLESATGNDQCRWDHPFVIVPPSTAGGQTWKATAACSLAVGKTAAKVQMESTSTVVGLRNATAAGKTVSLLRIDRQVTLRTTVNGQTATRRSAFVEYYDQARGLLAQSTEDATEDGPAGHLSYRITETLLTLQPEVR
ncbi:MAG TPA: hypothetical protein VFA94_17105 [Acidimicrobiales bacterium]|nr:hypothetical protein [Acidimicrobiales bacterium]